MPKLTRALVGVDQPPLGVEGVDRRRDPVQRRSDAPVGTVARAARIVKLNCVNAAFAEARPGPLLSLRAYNGVSPYSLSSLNHEPEHVPDESERLRPNEDAARRRHCSGG